MFERLSSLGYKKHLLNVQYRMHPSISCFPNSKFYSNKISDCPNVKTKAYVKKFLDAPMFGSYSFIDINYGREEKDGITLSWKNMVEVDVVVQIIHKLYKGINIISYSLWWIILFAIYILNDISGYIYICIYICNNFSIWCKVYKFIIHLYMPLRFKYKS